MSRGLAMHAYFCCLGTILTGNPSIKKDVSWILCMLITEISYLEMFGMEDVGCYHSSDTDYSESVIGNSNAFAINVNERILSSK